MFDNMTPKILRDRTSGWILTIGLMLAFLFVAGPSFAQATPPDFDGVSPEGIGQLFGSKHGDAFTSLFLHQMFGPLFPAADGTKVETVFANIIGYFNVFILVVGGLMFFYNVTVGVLQSAHEGEVLGRRWSSLWAPLRVIFAVGLLVPVPGLGGYNIAQAGVAYLVKGSTNFATMVWTASAKIMLDDNIAIAGAPAKFDPMILETLYRNEACMMIVNTQMEIIDSPYRVNYVPLASFSEAWDWDMLAVAGTMEEIATDRYHRTWVTALTEGGGTTPINTTDPNQGSRAGICGKYTLPEDPIFIKNIETASASSVPEGVRQAVRTSFTTAHQKAMNTAIAGVRGIVNDSSEAVMGGDPTNPSENDALSPNLPSFQNRFASLMIGINEQLSADIQQTRTLATRAENENKNQYGRDALKARITGNCSGSGDDSSKSGSEFSEECYGEGWLGAGSWYMLLAQVNNEIASLSNASPEASNGVYLKDVESQSRGLYLASGGEYSGGWFGSSVGESWGDADKMASQEDSQLMMTRFMETYTQSTQGLAALGFSLSPEAYSSFRDMSDNDSQFGKFFDYVGVSELVYGAIEGFFLITSPSNWGEDPMIGIMEIGRMLIGISTGAMISVSVIPFIGAGLVVPTAAIFYPIMVAGSAMAFVLPILPFLFWVLAITAYFLLIAEAIVAVNLWALSHMKMDGEGISGEAGSRGWLLLLALAFTPILMIFGFMIGMTLFRVTTALLDIGLYNAMQGIMNANIIAAAIGVMVYSVLIVLAYMVILERSFSLVAEFPGKVLSWINVTASLDSGESGRVRAAAMGTVYAGTKGQGKTAAGMKGVKKGVAGAARGAGKLLGPRRPTAGPGG